MNKHFVFVDDSWWNNPPCDCCPSNLVGSWTCTSHEEIKWSCLDEYECLASVYSVVFGIIIHHLDKQEGVKVFEQMLKELDITIEFIEQY